MHRVHVPKLSVGFAFEDMKYPAAHLVHIPGIDAVMHSAQEGSQITVHVFAPDSTAIKSEADRAYLFVPGGHGMQANPMPLEVAAKVLTAHLVQLWADAGTQHSAQ